MMTRCALMLLALAALLVESGCCCHRHCLRQRCCEPCCRPSGCCESSCCGYTPLTPSPEPAYIAPVPGPHLR